MIAFAAKRPSHGARITPGCATTAYTPATPGRKPLSGTPSLVIGRSADFADNGVSVARPASARHRTARRAREPLARFAPRRAAPLMVRQASASTSPHHQARRVRLSFVWTGSRSTGQRRCPRRPSTGIRCRRSWTTVGDFFRRRQPRIVVPECTTASGRPASRRRRPTARAAAAGLPRNRYFFSGSDAPGCLNGNVLNIDFAWFCICSCICTNMFFDCSM